MRATDHDTIAAISTPLGEGGIGIVRVSGSLSLSIADRIFQASHSLKPSSFPSHTLHHGYIIDSEKGERVDEVLLSVMRSPHSYTCEDVVEINGHGGLIPLLRILELVLNGGARLAAPGEFTRRAFLNGRIDLAQAEAVVEIVHAKSERGLMLAMRHLDGSVSRRIKEAKARVLSLWAEAEAAIDFPEEGLETIAATEAGEEMERIGRELNGLILSFQEGRIFEDGIATALIGRPNVGKSSLFNAFLERDRAIVTPQPGTTRDALEEMVNLQGLPFRLIDTAGMRGDHPFLEMAEREGVERGRAWMEKADLLLVLIDGSEPLTGEDRALLEEARGRRGILVVNKVDLPQMVEETEISELLPEMARLRVSARSREGLEGLKEAMVKTMERDGLDMTQDLVITRLHHRKALEKAQASLQKARDSCTGGLSFEFVSLDLRECLDALGEITGETSSEDLLDEIFSRFCVGK